MNESPQLQRIRDQLNASKGTWPEIQVSTGLSYFTIAKIAVGKATNPTLKTMTALEDYFSAKRKPGKSSRAG